MACLFAWASRVCLLCALCFLLPGIADLRAEQASVWSYKGSVLALSQSGLNVTIAYQTLSDALAKSGAHVGDPLFRGERTGNALHGRAYRFFGPQCEPIGFVVDGTIEGSQIVLRGIAPGLGLSSCKIETTYYDMLQLMAVATPGTSQQATLSPADASLFNNNIARCRTGDTTACQAVLASPLLTDERRASVEAAAALPAAASSPVYLLFRFQCVFENGKPVFSPSSEPYYHEALNYRPPASYAVCSPEKGGWVQSPITTCPIIELASLQLVCKGGIITAPQLMAANKTPMEGAKIEGEVVHVAHYSPWRSPDVPDGFHALPEGWAPIPPPLSTTAARRFEALFGEKRIPVSGRAAETLPRSVFLTLADWAPLPDLALLSLFVTAAAFAGCGFFFYPGSSLSPRRPVFWIWLVIAAVGISSALSAGHAIKDAFEEGRREAAAIEADKARLAALLIKRNGHVEPFRQSDPDLARKLQKPRTITNAFAVAEAVPNRAFLAVLPAIAFLVVYARFIYAGYHYFFVRHPIEATAGHELRTGDLFDLEKVGEALKPTPEDLFNPPPLHETLNKTRRAKAFREQTEIDADLAEVMMRRDRLRAQQHRAKADLRAIQRKLPWWRRWL